jgi:hypothetical protein
MVQKCVTTDFTDRERRTSGTARGSSADSNFVAARVSKLEELANLGKTATNQDLSQKLNWSGEQATLTVPRRSSRSLSPQGSPQASSTRRSNAGSSVSQTLPEPEISKANKRHSVSFSSLTKNLYLILDGKHTI